MWCNHDKWVSSRNTTSQFSSLSVLWNPPFNLGAPSAQLLTLRYVFLCKNVQIFWESSEEREQPSESQATICFGLIPETEIEASLLFPSAGDRWVPGVFIPRLLPACQGEHFFMLHYRLELKLAVCALRGCCRCGVLPVGCCPSAVARLTSAFKKTQPNNTFHQEKEADKYLKLS